MSYFVSINIKYLTFNLKAQIQPKNNSLKTLLTKLSQVLNNMRSCVYN